MSGAGRLPPEGGLQVQACHRRALAPEARRPLTCALLPALSRHHVLFLQQPEALEWTIKPFPFRHLRTQLVQPSLQIFTAGVTTRQDMLPIGKHGSENMDRWSNNESGGAFLPNRPPCISRAVPSSQPQPYSHSELLTSLIRYSICLCPSGFLEHEPFLGLAKDARHAG